MPCQEPVLLLGAHVLTGTAGYGDSLCRLANSARSVSLDPPSLASLRALNPFTHRPNVALLTPSSIATVATARPVLM